MSQERVGSLRVVPHEDLGDAGRLGHALDLERELPRRMSVLLEGLDGLQPRSASPRGPVGADLETKDFHSRGTRVSRVVS